jgi:hypothetical protein
MQGGVNRHPGNAREHVEAPEPAHAQVDERAQILWPGDVGALVGHLAATGRDGVGGAGQLLLARAPSTTRAPRATWLLPAPVTGASFAFRVGGLRQRYRLGLTPGLARPPGPEG